MTADAISASRIAEGARALGAPLSGTAADELAAYLSAMLEENRMVNLTGIRDPLEATILHALDSAPIARLGGDLPALAVDLGTGNGFPGVAVAAAFPEAKVTLLDRTQKKVAAIARALRRSSLDRVRTLALDAAQVRAHAKDLADGCDLVTARAVGSPENVARLARPLCAGGGRLALWLGSDTATPDDLANFQLSKEITYELPEPCARQRRIAIFQAV